MYHSLANVSCYGLSEFVLRSAKRDCAIISLKIQSFGVSAAISLLRSASPGGKSSSAKVLKELKSDSLEGFYSHAAQNHDARLSLEEFTVEAAGAFDSL